MTVVMIIPYLFRKDEAIDYNQVSFLVWKYVLDNAVIGSDKGSKISHS